MELALQAALRPIKRRRHAVGQRDFVGVEGHRHHRVVPHQRGQLDQPALAEVLQRLGMGGVGDGVEVVQLLGVAYQGGLGRAQALRQGLRHQRVDDWALDSGLDRLGLDRLGLDRLGPARITRTAIGRLAP